MTEKQDETEEGISSPLKVQCKGICRDGTNCLNRAKYNGYCRWHKKIPVVLTNTGTT